MGQLFAFRCIDVESASHQSPRECIDYVILHELCHLAEHNHSDRFWRLLTQVMPNWEKVKTQLDGMAELYLSGV